MLQGRIVERDVSTDSNFAAGLYAWAAEFVKPTLKSPARQDHVFYSPLTTTWCLAVVEYGLLIYIETNNDQAAGARSDLVPGHQLVTRSGKEVTFSDRATGVHFTLDYRSGKFSY